MCTLRQPPPRSKQALSSLQQRLKNPRTWLLLIAALIVLTILDTFQSPQSQVTGGLYVKSVRLYQLAGRPLLKGRVQCRYCPSCSEYSIEAVETHGIRPGLMLTVKRVASCQETVPLGTFDPVPPAD